jgi:hypothetical protein
MVQARGNRGEGHPPRPIDPEEEALQRQGQELEAKLQVLEQREQSRQLLEQPDKRRMRWPS